MKTFFVNIGHSLISLFLFALPIVLAQNFQWQSLTVGTILVSLQHYFVTKQAVNAAGGVKSNGEIDSF